ncbi:MAG: sulfatase-like hydrolase/transferase [Planctomycetota bacterium]|jgi:arylsulfatase A-like enzyme
MRRRDFITAAGKGAAGIAIGTAMSCGDKSGESALPSSEGRVMAGEPTNLLFIMTDQQRFDAMSCAGNSVLRTPNLDRLASQGARFTLAHSHCPVCAPDRATILTGRTIESTLMRTNEMLRVIKPHQGIGKLQTFDEVLASAGYHCEFHGKFHVAGFKGDCYARNTFQPAAYREYMDANVPKRRARKGELLDGFHKRPYRPNPLDTRWGLDPGAKLRDSRGREVRLTQPDNHGEILFAAEHSVTAFQARSAIEAIRRSAAAGKPFSVTCSFHYPHAPMLPTAPYYGMYPVEEMTPPPSISDPMKNNPYARANHRHRLPKYREPEKIKYMISEYYGLVREIDDWGGKILAALEETGQAKNTLVVFTSDHGEMLGDHGMREKNIFLEGSVRVPLMMRLPGRIRPGTVVGDPVGHLDMFATVLDYLGVKAPASDGKSLRGLVEGRGRRECAVAEWNYNSDGTRDNTPNFMVRTREWKFIFCRTERHKIIDCLFNLQDDPHEMQNLIGRNPDKARHRDVAERMKKLLLGYMEEVRHPKIDEVARKPAVV